METASPTGVALLCVLCAFFRGKGDRGGLKRRPPGQGRWGDSDGGLHHGCITDALRAPESAYSANGALVSGWPLRSLRALRDFFLMGLNRNFNYVNRIMRFA